MRASYAALVVGLLCTAVPSVALAEPDGVAESEAESSEPAAEAIALSEIGEAADETKTQIEGIKTRTEDGPSLAAVDNALPEIVARLEALTEEIALHDIDTLSGREIEDLTFAWQQVARKVDTLQSRLGDESGRFESELARVQTMLARWGATEALPGITPTAKTRTHEIQLAAKELESDLRGHLDTIHTAQKRVSTRGSVVTQRLAAFAVAREGHRSRILTRGDPLWRVDPRSGESPLHLLIRTGRRQIGQIGQILGVGLWSLVALVLTWLLAWWALVVLGRRPIPANHEVTAGLKSSLARPRSAALVLAVGGFALIGPPVPWALRQAMWLLTLPALLRLLGPTPYRPVALAFAGPLTLSLLSEIVPASSAWARYVHLAVSVCGLLAALWLRRRHRDSALQGMARRGMRVAEVLLALSIAANVVGYGTLAPVINHATMFGIFLAVLIVAVVGVCDALAHMSVETDTMRRSNAVRRYGAQIAKVAVRYVRFAAWIIWVGSAAEGFGFAEPAWTWLRSWLEDPWEFGAFAVAPGDLVAFGLALYAALLTSRLLGFALDEDVLPRLNLARGLPPTVSMLARYAVLAIGFMIAVVAAGVELDKLSLLVGAFGVGIGFGLQNVVNNFVSGLILMFERPVKIGDTVEVGTLLGEVKRIGIRASTLRTLQGAEVIVPNANIISNEVINWTLSDRRRRVDIQVGVAYGTAPEQVIELLVELAARNRRVLSHPQPAALFVGFGASSLDFQLQIWTADFDDWRGVRSDLTVAVNRALVDAEIEVPFPQRDLHLRSVEGHLIEATRRSESAPTTEPDSDDESTRTSGPESDDESASTTEPEVRAASARTLEPESGNGPATQAVTKQQPPGDA